MSYFVSWSGGKDSCLALCHAYEKFGKPKYLVCMLNESGKYSRSHGLSRDNLNKQAEKLNVPILFYSTSWNDYEHTFLEALSFLKTKNVKTGVFGDLKIADKPDWTGHTEWAEKICSSQQMKAFEPLWDYQPDNLMDVYYNSKIKAKIVSINNKYLGSEYLGKILTRKLSEHFKTIGIDPFGEKGEFHTYVLNCPYFKSEIKTKEALRDKTCLKLFTA